MNKGLVVELKEDYAVVLTSENAYTRVKLKGELRVGSSIYFTSDDVYLSRKMKGGFIMKTKFIMVPIISLALILVLTMSIDGFLQPKETIYSAIVTVDINPGVKLMVDEDGIVRMVDYLNEDAKTLEIEVVGLKVVRAIENIVSAAEKSEFLNTTDLIDDFILVTTVDADMTDGVDISKLNAEIIESSNTSEVLQKVNVALTEINLEQLDKAIEAQVPAGLQSEGATSVKEYFSSYENVSTFRINGTVSDNSVKHQMAILENQIHSLDIDDEIKKQLVNEFNVNKDEFIKSRSSYIEAIDNYQNAKNGGDEEKIEEAKQQVEQANIHMMNMDAYKEQIETMQKVMVKTMDGEMSQEQLQGEITMLQKARQEMSKGEGSNSSSESGQDGSNSESGQGGSNSESGQDGSNSESGQGGSNSESGQGGNN